MARLARGYRDGGGRPPHRLPRPFPGLSWSGGRRPGRGVFACKVCRYEGARAPYTPFGDPYPHRLATYGHRPTPPYWTPTPPHRLTGLPPPPPTGAPPPSVPPTLTYWMALHWPKGDWPPMA